MKQNVQHIDIPFDELGTFKQAHEDQYQNILIETLLLTTLATFHLEPKKKNHKSATFLTKKSIWISDKKCVNKPKVLLPIKSIVGIVKSYKNPQFALITDQNQDNIRVTTTSDQRCWYLISTISYVFTYVLTKELCFITIKNNSLDYFQRTVEDKKKGKNINLNSGTYAYTKQMIVYTKPFKHMINIYGHIKERSKIILQRQLQAQTNNENNNHQIYLARIKEDSFEMDVKQKQRLDRHKGEQREIKQMEQISQCLSQEQEDRYICHYIQKKQEYLQSLYEHRNLQFITQMIYAKNSQFKIQIFFEYSQSLRDFKVNPIVFKQIWILYDKVKAFDSKAVITTDSLLLVERSGLLGEKKKKPKLKSEKQYLERWIKGQYAIVMKQFRYQFLRESVEWDRFIYEDQFQDEDQCSVANKSKIDTKIIQNTANSKVKSMKHLSSIQKQLQLAKSTAKTLEQQNYGQYILKPLQYNTEAFHSKIYNIGLILYQLATGRHLLLYTPPFINTEQAIQEQIEMISVLKNIFLHSNEEGIEIFPHYMRLCLRENLQSFIKCCIFRKFDNYEQLQAHLWMRELS